MAKNIQIVPTSGSIEFQDTAGDNIKYTYESGRINVTVGGTNVMYFDSGSNKVGINNTSKLAIPVRTPTPEDPEGTLSFNSEENSLDINNGGENISLQGHKAQKELRVLMVYKDLVVQLMVIKDHKVQEVL